jgi:putative transposase
MKKKRHSQREIDAKLRQAESMAAEGKRQSEIVRALRISAMTYHRWRKARKAPVRAARPSAGAAGRDAPLAEARPTRANELELENQQLRRLVTDLLLEKLRLEEALQARRPALESVRE